MFTKVVGHGYPIVLMHGGPGADHSTLSALRPCADTYTLIYYDHRCNGRSRGADVTTLTWDNLTADADALRQTLGFERWAILGHSFGGMVALEYALRYPDRVSHLMLLDTCGDIRVVQQNAPRLLTQRGYSAATVKTAERFFNGQLTSHEIVPAMLRFGSAYIYRQDVVALVHELVTSLRIKARPETTVFGFSQLLKNWTVMDRLHEITAPTLVSAGRHDFEFPPEHQALLAERICGAQLAIIERAGHNSPLEQPAEVRRLMRQFLNISSVSAA